jgi:hypothetical protein
MVGGIENEGESMPKTRKNHPPSLRPKRPWSPSRRTRRRRAVRTDVWRTSDPNGRMEEAGAAGLPDIIGNGRQQVREQGDAEKDELYKQIGQLKVELDFLKKKAGLIG